jgi:hypothetical protein
MAWKRISGGPTSSVERSSVSMRRCGRYGSSAERDERMMEMKSEDIG